MDYRNKFDSIVSSIITEKETFGMELMTQLKQEGRTFEYVNESLSAAFFHEIKKFDLQSPYDLAQSLELLTNFSRGYSIEPLQNALKNEMMEYFTKNYKKKSYSNFIEQMAIRFGLRRAYLANKWNFDYSEYLYNNGDFERYTLQLFKKGISSSKMYSSYRSTSKFQREFIYIHKPNKEDKDNLEKLLQEEITKEISRETKSKKQEGPNNLPSFTEEQKLLLIHYLIRSKYLEKIEKVKILALLGNSPISIDIFKQDSRNNTQYQEVLKGYRYRGIKKAQNTLNSLFEQVEMFNIDNLNRAIKMDLNAIKKEKIKKNFNKD